ncbi:MAG: dihydroorotase [Acidobacteria bacterium]|nr:dihydroorotase [Acidobacteriota bacterium]
MKTLIKNGRVIDPANGIDDALDVLLENGIVAKVAKDIKETGAKTISAAGKVVAPGFIDMHVHLREPGHEEEETIQSGGEAAAAGGFTAVACMPNTDPVNDNSSVTKFILKMAAVGSPVKVYPIGAISHRMEGELLAEIGDMYKNGCVAVSDDGKCIMDNLLMRKALEYSTMFDIPVIDHPEAHDLTGDGVMNESVVSTSLGLRGIPASAEEIMVQRDIILAADANAHIHIAHVSTEGSVDLIRRAKKKGIKITAEVTPHHFTLTDNECVSFDTNLKMKPPLRTENDLKAILKGIKDGTIDAIASDHAPHHEDTKLVEFDYASFGIVGLETSISLALDKLMHSGLIDINRLVEMYSTNPAKILRLPGGNLSEGSPADITIIDFNRSVAVDKNKFRSKSKNTPFHGMNLKGAAVMTIVDGEVVFQVEE